MSDGFLICAPHFLLMWLPLDLSVPHSGCDDHLGMDVVEKVSGWVITLPTDMLPSLQAIMGD